MIWCRFNPIQIGMNKEQVTCTYVDTYRQSHTRVDRAKQKKTNHRVMMIKLIIKRLTYQFSWHSYHISYDGWWNVVCLSTRLLYYCLRAFDNGRNECPEWFDHLSNSSNSSNKSLTNMKKKIKKDNKKIRLKLCANRIVGNDDDDASEKGSARPPT